MRASRWWFRAAGALVAGGLGAAMMSAACQKGDCSVTGCPSIATCTLLNGEAQCVKNPVVAMMVSGDSGMHVMDNNDAGPDAAFGFGPPPKFPQGDGGACISAVGTTPSSTCDPTDEMGCAALASSGCVIDPKCTFGDPACGAFVRNDGKVDNFRMRYIELISPPALTGSLVQNTIVTSAVDLPATPANCGENGKGVFNWLISVNVANKTITTGGAPESIDPFGVGYCFFNKSVNGLAVGPITMQAKFTGNTFTTTPLTEPLNIPIFINQNDFSDSNVVILPIHGAYFHDVTVSNDGNCIGQVNDDALQPTPLCTDPSPTGADGCSRWHTAGALGGYITLKEANDVVVIILHESLCDFLTGRTYEQPPQTDGGPSTCTAAAFNTGTYCSTSNPPGPGGCKDSVWLSALFAASAVTINDGAGVSVCAPVGAGDAGSGTGTGSGSGT